MPTAPHHDPEPVPSPEDEDETEHQRLNRQLDQLLSELRVALPGVQVLLAFLLIAPFNDRFESLDGDGEIAYAAAVALAALASILLIAPTVQHRVVFRRGAKAELIRMANHLTIAGAVALGASIGCALYVVGDLAFPRTPLRWLGPAVVAVAGVLWFVVPLRYAPPHRAGAVDDGRPTGRRGPPRP